MRLVKRRSRDGAERRACLTRRAAPVWRAVWAAVALVCADPGLGAAAAAQATPGVAVVGVVSSRADMPLAEDLATVLAHEKVRVLPIAGWGPVQNAADLLHLKGIDFAILPSDLFAYLGREKLLPEAVSRLRLVTQIYHKQFHLLARSNVPDMAALSARKVSFGPRGSDDDVTATLVFDAVGVQPAPVHLDEEEALDALLSGRIDAIAVTAQAPTPLLQAVNREQGVHFLPVPGTPVLRQLFRPAQLGIEEYPLLIGAGEAGRGHPVPTVEIGEELAAYDFPPASPRGRNAARFVDVLFHNFAALRTPPRDPRWRDADLSAMPPGWTRYAPAVAWMRGAPVLSGSSAAPRRPAVDNARPDTRLFQEFLEWRQRRQGQSAPSDEAPR